jgi:hypothetical protein
MSTISIQFTPFTRVPRGALWAGEAFSRLLNLFAAHRAPAVPSSTTRAEEAEAVREMASQIQATDPAYADDLYAAADRHERLPG